MINEVATLASSMGKVSKREAWDAFLDIVELYPDIPTRLLAQLYVRFQPPQVAKPKNVFHWCSRAMGKKDVRYFLNYVYVSDNDEIVATDGKRLHITKNTMGLQPGYYDKNMNRVDVEQRYANYSKVWRHGLMYENDCNVNKTVISGKGGRFGDLYLFDNGVRVVKKYFDDATAFIDRDSYDISIDSHGIQIQNGEYKAVIMPIMQ